MRLARSASALFLLSILGIAKADGQLLPAGQIVACTLEKPDLSPKTSQMGDPVVCHLDPVFSLGKPLFPRGSYLTGTLTEGEGPGKPSGKGYLALMFNRLVLPEAEPVSVVVKVIDASKHRVRWDGVLLDKGHIKREAVEWVLPVMWPVIAVRWVRRSSDPAHLGSEERLLLRVMEDALIPSPPRSDSSAPTVLIRRNRAQASGNVYLIR